MKDKYYTPEIEEFHVGFEYEFYGHNGWSNSVYGGFLPRPMSHYLEVKEARVKHLDGADIESLGFYLQYPESKNSGYIDRDIYEDGCCGIDLMGDSRVGITRYNYPNTSVVVLTIKNKSELKRLLKQLGI